MSYGLDYDLVVYDESVKDISREYLKRGEEIENILDRYSRILKKITEDGIKSGKVNDNLKIYLEAVEKLKREASYLAERAEDCINNFISDIDIADNYLY